MGVMVLASSPFIATTQTTSPPFFHQCVLACQFSWTYGSFWSGSFAFLQTRSNSFWLVTKQNFGPYNNDGSSHGIFVLYSLWQRRWRVVLNHFCDGAVDDAALSSAQGVDDADALVDLDRDGLLGDPAVGVLQDG